MNSGRVDTGMQAGEFELELVMDEEDVQANIFRMDVNGSLNPKTSR